MEKLYELHVESDFDLVVVDTPPTRNALDFLDAPGTADPLPRPPPLQGGHGPTRGVMKVASVATQAFLRTVAKVVGSEVIDDAIAFFQAFQGMEEGFRSRAEHVDALLDDAGDPVRPGGLTPPGHAGRGRVLRRGPGRGRHPVSALIVNRMHPRFADGLAEAARERADTLAGTALGDHYANLADFQLIAGREEDHLDGLVGKVGDAAVVRVPFLRSDVHDLAGLDELATYVFAE